MSTYKQRLQQAADVLTAANRILIGGGAGLSDAAGLKYDGDRFRKHFAPFIDHYGMTDMYSSSFYPFKSEEARWAYWAVHIQVNRYEQTSFPLYHELASLMKAKNHFVITTNVDHQFFKAGFDPESIFAVQGDYGLIQCAKGCHAQLYDNEPLVAEWMAQLSGVLIPKELVPTCPKCGGPMDMNLRKDAHFVEDQHWHDSSNRYAGFARQARNGPTILLEMGVGFNTPGIIRFPFEQMTMSGDQVSLLRFNKSHPKGLPANEDKTVTFQEDMSKVVGDLKNLLAIPEGSENQCPDKQI